MACKRAADAHKAILAIGEWPIQQSRESATASGEAHYADARGFAGAVVAGANRHSSEHSEIDPGRRHRRDDRECRIRFSAFNWRELKEEFAMCFR